MWPTDRLTPPAYVRTSGFWRVRVWFDSRLTSEYVLAACLWVEVWGSWGSIVSPRSCSLFVPNWNEEHSRWCSTSRRRKNIGMGTSWAPPATCQLCSLDPQRTKSNTVEWRPAWTTAASASPRGSNWKWLQSSLFYSTKFLKFFYIYIIRANQYLVCGPDKGFL